MRYVHPARTMTPILLLGLTDETAALATFDREPDEETTSFVPALCGTVGIWMWRFSLAGPVALEGGTLLTRGVIVRHKGHG